MTNVTASSPYTSSQLQDAISRLEKMHVEAEEEVRQLGYESLKGGPEHARRDAHQHAQRVREARRWARGQALGRYRFLLPLLLKYYLVCFSVAFGLNLWDAFTTPVTGASGFGAMAFGAAKLAVIAGTIFGLMEWRRGRRVCSELLGPVLAKKGIEFPG